MNSVLDMFGHNLILDEIVYWPPQTRRLHSIGRTVPEQGKCKVRLEFDDGSNTTLEIERGCFESVWNEACAVLQAVTEVRSDLSLLTDSELDRLEPDRRCEQLRRMREIARDALRIREEKLRYAVGLFKSAEYGLFLDQFGPNSSSLPERIEKMLALARTRSEGST